MAKDPCESEKERERMSESKEAGPNRKLGRIEGKIGRGEKERERKREEKIVYIVPDGTD